MALELLYVVAYDDNPFFPYYIFGHAPGEEAHWCG